MDVAEDGKCTIEEISHEKSLELIYPSEDDRLRVGTCRPSFASLLEASVIDLG